MAMTLSKKKEREKIKIIDRECPLITIIAAVSENWVIGFKNTIPWKIKNDLERFKDYTLNKPVLMGIKTFESLPFILPGRVSLVLTKNLSKVEAVVNRFKDKYPDRPVPPVVQLESIAELNRQYSKLKQAFPEYKFEELIIAGGSNVYNQFIDVADKIVLTVIKLKCEGDAEFPRFDFNNKLHWKITEDKTYFKNQQNEFDYKFFTFERPNQAKIISFSGKSEITKLDRVEVSEVVNGHVSKSASNRNDGKNL
jgi:dihydrofolate reductase